MHLKNVFSPIRINGLELANRIVMSSMHLNFEGDDQFDRLASFYALRGRDGPGLIVTGGCSPNRTGRASHLGFSIDSDALILQHRKIVSAVHAVGNSKLALQLLHCGRESHHGSLVAPSGNRAPGNLFSPEAMSGQEIAETIESYASAAVRAVEAGYDAIEVVFSQGFLIHQFLSAHVNARDDDWGGDFGRRQRFAVAVAAAVRSVVGRSFPLSFRVPCLDLLPKGLSFDESMALIGALQPYQIDLLNVGIGWHESSVPTTAHTVPPGGFASIASRVKNRFPRLLTCVSNRVSDLRQAEELLIVGAADMVAMGRPFLADKDIVCKSRLDQFDEVCRCIACNQDCLEAVFQGRKVGCSVNPECGTEDEGRPVAQFSGSPAVAVVGGGLAGMSSACELARRGARVTLFERSMALGGQVLLASRIPGKAEYQQLVRYFETRLRRLGVTVCRSREFGSDDVASRAWNHVVIATGSEPNELEGPFGERMRVIGYRDLVAMDLPVEYPVVIVGGGGVALDVAKLLLARQSRLDAAEEYLMHHRVDELVGRLDVLPRSERTITILQRSTRKIGYKLGRTARSVALGALERAHVAFIRGASAVALGCREVLLRLVNGEERRVPACTVIVASGQHADTSRFRDALSASGTTYSVVGAARCCASSPAGIAESIRSGYLTARDLEIPSP